MSTKIEFAVQMTCEKCVSAVRKSLDVAGVEKVDVNLQTGSVVVDTTLTTEDIQKRLESSGRKAVVKGLAGSLAGVAILDTGNHNVQGVVRFVQINQNTCIVDGTIDGLNPGVHGLFVHETGDISRGCDSVGDCYNPKLQMNGDERLYGNLGSITAEKNGRAAFRLQDSIITLSDVIGRSLVVTEHPGTSNEDIGKRLACGIIARSSGLFQNPKTICACDGISIWDERNKPKSTL
ncbi:hypothetical protein ILUMI_12311 [Ignelater luminosus]|uniref:superoxide dismutase n=1 Tax=Ignelater luminosus TaxID=2038154 RepID=A0A8K0CUH3_IGNLU|nr:hypothetical protein ILUMI_12311 [Ignelater luminosus]